MDIELRHIHKRFGSVHANNDINTVFPGGRIIGVLGENGAGKSTLMKILSGFQPADEGEIWIDGEHVNYHGPEAAIAHGIGMLQQDPLDVGAFTVLENFTYGDTPTRQAVGRLLDVVAGQAETFHISHYQLSAETDIRILVARTLLVVVAIAAAWTASTRPADILAMVSWAFSLAAAGLFPALVLGIWWKRTTTLGALAGIAAGFGITLFYLVMTKYGGMPLWGIPGVTGGIQNISAAIIGLPFGVLVILIGVAVSLFTTALKSEPRSSSRSTQIEAGRVMLERITRELRQGDEISTGESSQLEISTYAQSACGETGGAGGSACEVSYTCSEADAEEPDSVTCSRSVEGGSPTQLVSGLAKPDVFTYQADAGGTINFVEVELVFHQGDDGESVTLSDGVAIRNQTEPSG